MKTSRIALLALVSAASAASAQTRELPPNTGLPPNYDYYTLNAGHTGQPQVLGWAETRIEEKLGRGMLAMRTGPQAVYLGWRLLETDPSDIAFNVYRATAGGRATKLNRDPIRTTTDFIDTAARLTRENAWFVRPVVNGAEQAESGRVVLAANAAELPYRAIKLREDLDTRAVHKLGIGDLDGDGEYDFVVKRPGGAIDPGRVRRSPDTFKVEGYRSDGTFLWRNDLGWSIELGTWYSPMLVYDFSGDGKADVALKTGDGDPRDANGQVLTGPEYLSIWDGLTGRQVTRAPWPERGNVRDWGDDYGNRMNRNLMAIAYLDGKTPSVLAARGTYGLMKMDAWLLHRDTLRKAWHWTNQTSGFRYQGQGQHTIKVANIDDDPADEILNGAIAIDNDGRIMWSTGMGHGDRMYVTDVDPDRPGLEAVYIYEDPHPKNGFSLWDASTGDMIFGINEETADNQLGSAVVADIDPAHPGMELWADKYYFTARGQRIPGEVPPQTGLVWWDADLLREIAHRGTVAKWRGPTLATGIEGAVMSWADVVGDWREEIITFANGELRIYSTTIPAADRRVTLMQDPIYRLDVAHKAMGYDMPPMTSYYLGVR
ncbi:MAG: silent information regulator protein Sir2 [Gemmatimonadetes bacterium]|nr:silent information regulator protein Sir2 [Gemmatimonadota bacterium]